MSIYLPPLAVIFVWHPDNAEEVKPLVDHCFSLLSRDINKPFSRSMNLPIFFRTATKNGVPAQIDIQANKTVIFIFVSKDLAADPIWIKYIRKMPELEKINIIPIALDKDSLAISDIFSNKNFIREYDFDLSKKKHLMFLSVAHEIYRYALNESFNTMALGSDNALSIFLSHAKDGENGIKIATALKRFIDNSVMKTFFDATDIAPGYSFDKEIVGHIKNSTIIAIHSDIYSSRYWCQLEIMSAKENNRPIIAVDALENFEDRKFPFATNVPAVHVHVDGKLAENDLLRILSATLLETIRFFYSKLMFDQYKNAGWINSDAEISCRPPEISDIEKLLIKEGNSIQCQYTSIVYPEPPLYAEELSFLTRLGIKHSTPLTTDLLLLSNKNIGISISDLSEEELIDIGQEKVHLVQLSQDLARHLLAREATLIYGGDLREGGFTEFIFNEAKALQDRIKSNSIHINNYIAWPIYKNDTEKIKTWKVKYRHVASVKEIGPPKDVKDLIVTEDKFLPPAGAQNMFVWSRCLSQMRKDMIDHCDIRICAGGRHSGYKGKMPGVLEEMIIAIKMKRPLFLLGGFGGVTSSICTLIQSRNLPEKLTLDWQVKNNSGYKELLNFGIDYGENYEKEYALLTDIFEFDNLRNGLNQDDNIRLFNTPFIDEALYIIFKGLKAIQNS